MMLDATLQPEGVDEVSVEIDEIEIEDNLQNQEYETIASANAALESYIDILKSNDGLTRQSAAILNVGLNNCFKTLGLKEESTGLEDYVSCNSLDARTQATVSIESLLEKAKAGIKKAIEWIIERLKTLKTWYDNIGNKAKKTKAEAEDLGEAIKSGKGGDGAEFELKGHAYFRLKPSIVNNQLVNEATTEVYKWMHKFTRDYPKAISSIIPNKSEVAKNEIIEESYKAIVDTMPDIELENNFSLSNVRLEDNVIVADFETVPAEDIGKIIMRVRDENAITNDLKVTVSILEKINDVFGYLDDLSELMTKQIQGLEDALEDDDVHKVILRNRLIVNNLINNPPLRRTLSGYIEYIHLKLTVIRKEITANKKELPEKE